MGKLIKKKNPLLLCKEQNRIEAGCDEAGRGCLAGPVFAAAVILPDNFYHEKLNDSKQLSEKEREELRIYIEEKALSYAVATCSIQEIEELNILWASVKAMHKALDKLTVRPEFILVDGNKFRPYKDIPHNCIIKGDATYMSIAAASILAKTYRDKYMEEIHAEYPVYLWNKNRGYATKAHRDAIRVHGITPHHRQCFTLLDNQLELDFKID